jgi:localization factor PodJL
MAAASGAPAGLVPPAVATTATPPAAASAMTAAVAAKPAAPAPIAGPADIMPRNPSAEAPLREFGFPDLGPVRAALGRKLHPGMDKQSEAAPQAAASLAASPELASATPGRAAAPLPRTATAPAFDAAQVARPPQPESSLGTAMDEVFAPSAATAISTTAEPVSPSSRNTFIEAARRSAQRQNAMVQEHEADSLIGRALSRFQPGPVAGKPVAARPAPEPVPPPPAPRAEKPVPAKAGKPVKADKPAKPGLFARKPKAVAAAAAVQPSVAEPAVVASGELPDMTVERRAVPKEGFLARHRKPILIAASLVAVSFMTLNLVMQRLASDGAHATPAPAAAAKPAPKPVAPKAVVPAATAATPAATPKPTSAVLPQAVPAATTAAAAPTAGPRIVPTNDPVTTASISPAALNYVATPAAEPLPPALAAANSAASASPAPAASDAPATATPDSTAPAALESPVKVDLPPDTLGPLALRQAAADGDARSQFEVAAIYSEGRAVPQDDKQAEVWYERAAAQGFAPAQYRLGNLYETGNGVAKDFEQARLWYQRAAEAGNRMAMHNLAALYAGGQFGKQDFVSAANWFEQAANRGMKDSQFNLGMLYARGLGVPQSLETSYKWFALAASTGDADAAKARDNIARSLDAETLKKANADVAAWKETSIDLAANFAPIGTWQKDFNPGPAITSKDVITKVQTALARLGFDIGNPNGHLGAKTAEAIKAFERGTGMTEVGAVNPRLLAVLGSQPV